MSQLTTDGTDPQILPRHQRPLRYHVYLVGTMIFATIMLMFVPYVYDQYNYDIYDQAAKSNNLIIQDFQSAYVSAKFEKCKSTQCTSDTLTKDFKTKKLIALDYIEQMEKVGRLGLTQFVGLTFFSILAVGLFVTLTTKLVDSPRWRITCILVAVIGAIGSIQILYIVGSFSHINIKFYYLFGVLIALVLSISDYLHHVKIVADADGDKNSKYVAISLQETHRKWTTILGYAMTIMFLIVGTISFNSVAYIKATFGDSFLLAPTVGMIVGFSFLLVLFAVGVVGNIRKILVEIEGKISSLK